MACSPSASTGSRRHGTTPATKARSTMEKSERRPGEPVFQLATTMPPGGHHPPQERLRGLTPGFPQVRPREAQTSSCDGSVGDALGRRLERQADPGDEDGVDDAGDCSLLTVRDLEDRKS